MSKPRIVILGGGFGGIGAAEKLKHADAEIVLIDKHDYHTFQPMIYQVATDVVASEEVGHPLRDVFRKQPNVTIHQAHATAIDLAKREVSFQEMEPLAYDYLVLALGAQVNFFGTKGAAENAFPMYTLSDAVKLKHHILKKWEAADKNPALVEDGALNVVIVGGGPTGVECAGAIIELYRGDFVKDYRNLPAKDARVMLYEHSDTLLAMFKKDIQTYTIKALKQRGVEIFFGEKVVEVAPTRVTLESGEVVKAHTLVWGAGLQANEVVKTMGIELQRGGRVPVGLDLRVKDQPNVYAVGDIAWIEDENTREILPQLGGVALQSGQRAGENIMRQLKGQEPDVFDYFDKGIMATIGRGAAVAQLPTGNTLKGKTAQAAWAGVHLELLTGGDSRAKTALNWSWTTVTRKRTERVIVDED